MIIALIIIGSILGYGLMAGATLQLFPTKVLGEKVTIDKESKTVWSCFWPVLFIVLTVLFLIYRPFVFGQWLVKKLDERFDLRK